MLTTKLMPLLTLALLLVSAVQTHAHGDHHDTDAAGEFDDYDEGVSRVKLHAPPESLLDFLGLLAPVLKYYVVLMGLFVIARYFNRMVEAEDVLKEKEMLVRFAGCCCCFVLKGLAVTTLTDWHVVAYATETTGAFARSDARQRRRGRGGRGGRE